MDTNVAGYFATETKLVFVLAICTSLDSTSLFFKFLQIFSFSQLLSFKYFVSFASELQ